MASGSGSYHRAKRNRIVHKMEEARQLKMSLDANIERFVSEATNKAREFLEIKDRTQRDAAFRAADEVLESCIIKLTNLSEIEFCQDGEESNSSDISLTDVESLNTSIAASVNLNGNQVHSTEVTASMKPSSRQLSNIQLSAFSPQSLPSPDGHRHATHTKTKYLLRPDIDPFIPKGTAANHCRLDSASSFEAAGTSSTVERFEHLADVPENKANRLAIEDEDIDITELDVLVGQELICVMTHAESPSLFYLQLVNSETLPELIDNLTSFYEEHDQPLLVTEVLQLRIGMVCCALEAKMHVWQRAVITKIHPIQSKKDAPRLVTVRYVDYGDSEEVPVTKLQKLDSQFCHFPCQVIPCSLNGVGGSPWNDDHIALFRSLVNTSMVRVVIVRTGLTNTVDLFLNAFEGDIEMNVSEMFQKSLAPKDELSPVFTGGNNRGVVEQKTVIREYKEEGAETKVTGGFSLPPQKTSFQLRPIKSPTLTTVRPPCFQSDSNSDDNRAFELKEIDQRLKTVVTKDVISAGANSSLESDLSIERLDIPVLQLELDQPLQTFTAIMACFTDPSNFYVHPVTNEIAQIDNLCDDLQKTYAKSAPPFFLEPREKFTVGSYWCCRFHEDSLWYRGKIMEVQPIESQAAKVAMQNVKVHVLYVDYGNSAWLDVSDLRILFKRFCQLPAMAVKCRLANVGQGRESLGTWSQKSIEIMKNVPREEPITLKLVEKKRVSDEGLSVVVWDKNDVLLNAVLPMSCSLRPSSQNLKNGKEDPIQELNDDVRNSDDDLKSWDPMYEAFVSPRNSYMVDADDAGVALTGYKARDESVICIFYQRGQWCRRGNSCPYRHIQPPKDGRTTDAKIIPNTNEYVELPDVNTSVAVEVAAILDPSTFYVNFPLSTQEPIDRLSDENFKFPSDDLYALVEYMQAEYKDKGIDRHGDYLLRACGELVAAKCSLDGKWYRGRVLDVDQLANTVTVSLVDFGYCEVLPECDIRDIQSKFLHLPLQAVECSLSGVEPADGKKWSDDAKNLFARITYGKHVDAHVIDIIQDRMVVELTVVTSSRKQGIDVINGLISTGFARRKSSTNVASRSVLLSNVIN